MGKKSAPSGVKNAESGFDQIGDMTREQAEQQWKWANERQEYDQGRWRDTQGAREGIEEGQLEWAGGAFDRAAQDRARSDADRARYEELYQPLEEQYLQDVAGYDTASRRTSASAAAQAEVASQAEASRTNALRRLESYGVDPSQTRNAALDSGIRMEEAKAKALAGTQARRDVESTGLAMKEGTVGAGRALDAQSRQNAAMAAGDAGAGYAIPEFGANQVDMWGQGNDAMGGWGQALGHQAELASQQQANKQKARSGIGSAIGTGAGYYFGGPAGGAVGGAIGGMLAEGGEVKRLGYAGGGEVSGPGGPKDDAIPINVSDGEFVIPEEVVRRKGTEFFDKIIEKVKTENAEREQNAQVTADAMAIPPPEAVAPEGMPNPGMAEGGEVRRPLMFNQGGEVIGYADGGEVGYPPPPNAAGGI